MKATDVIRRDHEAAKELFSRFKSATEEERKDLEGEIFDALTAHERMEDEHFYPALRDKDIGDASHFSELGAEQKKLEAEVLAARSLPGDKSERILAIIDTVLEHATDEEERLLPEAEKALSQDELEALGEEMEPDSAVAQAGKQPATG